MKQYYYAYKIKNLINGKIYIGVHSTNNLDDGYMGSGLIISQAIEKYGIENFKKIILKFFKTSEEMFAYESIIVNEKFIRSDTTYNIREGGRGFTSKTSLIANKSRSEKISNGESTFSDTYKLKCQEKYGVSNVMQVESIKQRQHESLKKYTSSHDNAFKGKHHTDDAKHRIGEKSRLRNSGNGNPQYGKFWIHNPSTDKNKMIKPERLDEYLAKGWIKGAVFHKMRKPNNKRWVHINNKTKLINGEDFEEYLTNGWKPGRK
jgi:hypothetical protein